MTETTDQHRSRWPRVVACMVAMIAVANLQYAWSLFVPDLQHALHASLNQVQWAFTFFVIAQTVLFPLNAHLVDRYGPRIVVAVSSIFVAAGWVGAGMVHSLPALHFVSALGGIGAGGVYGACIGVAMKWFPDRRGLCVGLVAGSYGFGTALTVIPIQHMINGRGYQTAFIFWGVLQGAMVLLASQFMRMPPPGWLPAGWEAIKAKVQQRVIQTTRDCTPREMLRSKSFYLLYLMMVLVTSSGLMMTAQLKPIGVSYGYDRYVLFGGLTVVTVTLTSNQVLNGAARPFFGWVSDHLGRYDTMALVFMIEAVAIIALALLVRRPVWFTVTSGMMFFAWGDIYSLFPAAIADLFGTRYATTNYGLQYTSKGVGSILGGPAASWLMETTGSWIPVFRMAVLFNLAAAMLAILWLKPLVSRPLQERREPGAPIDKTIDKTIESVALKTSLTTSADRSPTATD
jgi:MFS transporter, OFA family, oxalate/formate antiporter